ncbi:NAD(P)/FAD-dependent oxidoreductase [Mycobacterium sp. CVI_P3]|uniref:NAD(P)/FAD-dependent oxidoreductase n=2 Tax=Mycobacterium pinniadriaticum TaxID=2994102 RepID=A0ABT3SLK2_9MYCO|nr:NAD(P)/FAD-dependent oxidoreductase [Mycobacterium pinniadriaticum]MCX2934005.1 NAD(P)/FAD-dependent oxidoreductase [Mycobacterium pinniadriaticum]MCX2940399.1 NAD(P)/FAD-dependent oxidoreductase [Mycobacterium pinniadriaticum]
MSMTPPESPIDQSRLEQAIGVANLPTLTMVLYQLTGEQRWLDEPFRPTRSPGLSPNDSGGFEPEVADEIRRCAVAAVSEWSRGVPAAVPLPDPDLLRKMLSICVDEEVPQEYERVMREEMGLEPAAAPEPVEVDDFSVVIIGAGISGIILAAQLQQLGISFVILERHSEVGGVWLTNTYPGSGVDTPSYLYSFSFFPRDWSMHFGKRDEMVTYLREAVDHFDIRRDIVFDTEVQRAEYDDSTQRWAVYARCVDGSVKRYSGNILISAVGLFGKPKTPEIPGLGSFRGPKFHTAEWPDELDLSGKRVAIIGSGASAMQVVPAIVDKVQQLTIFQRSPQWVAPCAEYFAAIPEDVHWLMNHVPNYHAWYRFRLAWLFNDRVHPSLQMDPEWHDPDRSLNAVNDAHRRHFTRYLVDQLDGRPDLISKCLPDYPPFGKRMLLDNGWFAALKRDNVALVTDAVAEVTESGLVTTTGEKFDADVLVFSTGFQTIRYLQPIEFVGRGGQRLSDVWGDDDATAYLGITVPEFPNLFLMYGPNTNSGSGGSYFFIGESQGRYILDVITKMVREGIGVVECRADAHDRWVREVDAEHSKMVWNHPGMTTYYRNTSGRVVTNSPYRVVDYWLMTHDADLADYITEPALSPDIAVGR